ncbi:MAG: hypothetical protein ACOC2D_16975 [Spirochaetota bacterium]
MKTRVDTEGVRAIPASSMASRRVVLPDELAAITRGAQGLSEEHEE